MEVLTTSSGMSIISCTDAKSAGKPVSNCAQPQQTDKSEQTKKKTEQRMFWDGNKLWSVTDSAHPDVDLNNAQRPNLQLFHCNIDGGGILQKWNRIYTWNIWTPGSTTRVGTPATRKKWAMMQSASSWRMGVSLATTSIVMATKDVVVNVSTDDSRSVAIHIGSPWIGEHPPPFPNAWPAARHWELAGSVTRTVHEHTRADNWKKIRGGVGCSNYPLQTDTSQ